MQLAIGGDHAGFELKKIFIEFLTKQGHQVKDFGPYSDASCDYPDFAHPLALAVENKEFDLGILICGSGNGVNMVANKHQGIRSALVWEVELAKMARLHNNANVVAIPARYISTEKALDILQAFLTTDFEGGRHENRVNKIACL
jgi:ribose 5-phosphate isomerase B